MFFKPFLFLTSFLSTYSLSYHKKSITESLTIITGLSISPLILTILLHLLFSSTVRNTHVLKLVKPTAVLPLLSL